MLVVVFLVLSEMEISCDDERRALKKKHEKNLSVTNFICQEMKSVLLGETGVANVRVVPTVLSGWRAPPINFRGLQMDPFTPLTSGEKHQREENKGLFKGKW